jgi:hypothetical protein
MTTKKLNIEIGLDATDRPFRVATFAGFAYLESGFLAGDILPAGEAIAPAELVLLTAFTLTGCPIAARCGAELINPWSLTGGAYRGFRSLIGRDFWAESILSATPVDDQISMRLQVAYGGSLPNFAAVARPFQEAIAQRTKGTLFGEFTIPFTDAAGRQHEAHATTRYELAVDVDVSRAWRNITILCSKTPNGLRQVEQIDMFDSESAAAINILDKVSVSSSAGVCVMLSHAAQGKHRKAGQ